MENRAETRRSQADGLAERETVLQWDLASDQVTGWTCDSNEANRWKRYGWPVEVFGTLKGKPHSWSAKVPRRCLRYVRFIKTKAPVLTPEQLQAKRESLKRAREARRQTRSQGKQTAKDGSGGEPGPS